MTLQELFENAHLDALGLLDANEQAAFERAFSVASPGVKSQIRAEQARWAESYALLPEIEPSAGLRERVLDGVGAAMLAAESGGNGDLEFGTTLRVARWWRPAAIGMLTAAVILGAAFWNVFKDNRDLELQISNNSVMNDMMSWRTGSGFLSDMIFDADTVPVRFEAVNAGFVGRATLFFNESRGGKAQFFWEGLPVAEGKSYQLVVLNGDQITQTLSVLTAERAIKTVGVTGLAKGMQLAVIAVGTGGVFDAKSDVVMLATV